MKKTIIAAMLAAAALSGFARVDDAAVANRKWVRKVVAEAMGKTYRDVDVTTNANGSITRKSAYHDPEHPEITAIAMTFVENTNSAIRLTDSTIPGLTNRVCFALDTAQGCYVNASNAVFRNIYAPKVDVVTVSTNYFTGDFSNDYVIVTNHSARTAYAATALNGTAYTCYKTNGVYWLRAVTNAAWKARITRTKVNDKRKAKLIGTPAPVVTRAARGFSLFDLLVPRAYAEQPQNGIGDDGAITWTFTIQTLTLTLEYTKDNVDIIKYVDIDISDLTFEYSGNLPEKPDGTHTCGNWDTDCNCGGYGLTYDDIESNPDYSAESARDTVSGMGEFSSWMTEDQWKAAGGKINKKGKWYMDIYISNQLEFSISPKEIEKSDAWKDQMDALSNAIVEYLAECQTMWKKAQICDQTNPQHDWHTSVSGRNAWRATRNGNRK